METVTDIAMPQRTAAQLALHVRLAAHHASNAALEPAAAEAILAWALVVASGAADTPPMFNGLPALAEIVDTPSALPAYRAALEEAMELEVHFDDTESFDLSDLYDNAAVIIEHEIERLSALRHQS